MELWVVKSFAIMGAMCIFMVLAPFMAKNYGIHPDITMFTWLFGAGVGIMFLSPDVNIESMTAQWLPVAVLLILGLTLGAYANVIMGRVVLEAPNPALPFAIVNAGSAVVYVATPILAIVAAKWFGEVQFTARGLTGVVIVLIGLYLVSTGSKTVAT